MNQLSTDSFEKVVNELFNQYLAECNADLAFTDGHLLGDEHLIRLRSLLPSAEASSQRSMLDSVYRFIAHISRSIAKPKLVQKALAETGLSADRTEVFVQMWKGYAPLIVDKLKTTSFEHSAKQLRDVNWKLKLLSEQSYDSQQKLPIGQLDLTFDSNTPTSRTVQSDLSLNFAHRELVEFYNNLESIQAKIDQLHQ